MKNPSRMALVDPFFAGIVHGQRRADRIKYIGNQIILQGGIRPAGQAEKSVLMNTVCRLLKMRKPKCSSAKVRKVPVKRSRPNRPSALPYKRFQPFFTRFPTFCRKSDSSVLFYDIIV